MGTRLRGDDKGSGGIGAGCELPEAAMTPEGSNVYRNNSRIFSDPEGGRMCVESYKPASIVNPSTNSHTPDSFK